LEPSDVVGIERDAEIGEEAELGRVVGVVCGEHTGGGEGGLGEWGTPVEDSYAGSAMVQFKGEGEADDAGTSDTDIWRGVGAMHKISLVGLRRRYSLVVSRCAG
jgi:hypothetical protein